ncbi:tRNA 2-selenouridine(34) synthase MnmH [Campylobacter peloridis]|uniref:tRNA 2-selenouridine(34) synthase MnmH n=1 Tax=Campylobacter peloridis TaxID=488546 RepID=A0ABX6TUK6_9BACT|nr:tRNA 2-selenouridine(34) synthase MnmH [Campylobacter peloridis]AJC84846.1 tRNA 2-selenouridine synthase [Campylobacter peloridis LMG 23910]QOQ88884.1 tRNA 2-selenouridine(34) synthase MnmH [Campylobacter peloridis]
MYKEVDFQKFLTYDFELLIDARSPREYTHAHIKNAKNYYALNDDEFEEIGTLYKKNKGLAKIKGASYICKNMSYHINTIYNAYKIGSLVGIYCARGGKRSKAIALILAELGYRVVRLEGGYKAYRSYVSAFFQKELKIDFLCLCGNTASGKSELIDSLPYALNLEKLANHQGSSFGKIYGKQPSQKAFEDELFYFLKNYSYKICFIEAESRQIGNLTLPLNLYNAMQKGRKIWCECALNLRVERILKIYAHIEKSYFYECVEKISPYISKDFKTILCQNYENNDLKSCVLMLIKYYDRVYKKPQKIDFYLNNDNPKQAKEKLVKLILQA